MKDNLIPYQHSQELHKACAGPSQLLLPPEMDHNDFDFFNDLIRPFRSFMKQHNISPKEPKSAHYGMAIPKEYFQIPKAYTWNHAAIGFSWSCYCMPQQGIPHYRARISVRDDEGNPTSQLNQSAASSQSPSYHPGKGLMAAQEMYQAYDEFHWQVPQ